MNNPIKIGRKPEKATHQRWYIDGHTGKSMLIPLIIREAHVDKTMR